MIVSYPDLSRPNDSKVLHFSYNYAVGSGYEITTIILCKIL